MNPILNSAVPGGLPGGAMLADTLPVQSAADGVRGALDAALPWLRELVVAAVKLNTRSTGDGVIDGNGAPALEPSLVDYSGDELALMLAAIDGKIKEGQAKTAKEGIEAARQQKESANLEMQTKLQEAIDKQKEADQKAKSQKVWGWLGKIAAVIGAVIAVIAAAAATVASAGTAAPLLALAVVGLVAATVDLASQINQEIHPDAKPFTLGSLIGDAIVSAMDKAGISGEGRAVASGFSAALGFLLMQPDLAGQMAEDSAIADGRSPEFASHMRMGVMIAAIVTTVVAMIAITIASGGASSSNLGSTTAKAGMKAADVALKTTDVATDAARVAQTAEKVIRASKVLAAFNGLVQGTTAIGAGATAIAVAEDTKAAEKARAEAKEIDAWLTQLQQQSEEQTSRLRDIITALQDGMAQFSDMIATAGDQRANAIRNLVRA